MIELIRVSRTFRNQRGVRDITLKLDKGDWVAVVGPAGAGKSTLLRMVYADLRPQSGEVIVGDYRLSNLRDHQIPRMRRMLGVVDQNLHLIEDRTALENVMLVGDVLGWPRRKNRLASMRALNQVGLYNSLDLLPGKLSSGERRRLAIARALVSEPLALIADEPLGHLDRETALGIVELLRRIHHRGMAILMATHRMELFEEVMDEGVIRVLRVERGEEVAS